jgi:cytochrome c
MRRLLVTAAFATLIACRSTPPPAESAPAPRGQALFQQHCAACHDVNSRAKKIGPGLKGVFQGEKLSDGKPATEANIRARIDSGGDGMPPFSDILPGRERDELIAYLKTL